MTNIYDEFWQNIYSKTAQKMKFSIRDFFSKCDQIHSLKSVTVTREILIEKLHFLYSVNPNQREELLARKFYGLLRFFSLHCKGQVKKLYSRRAHKLFWKGLQLWKFAHEVGLSKKLNENYHLRRIKYIPFSSISFSYIYL